MTESEGSIVVIDEKPKPKKAAAPSGPDTWRVTDNTQVMYEGVLYPGGETFTAPAGDDDVDFWVKAGWIVPA
jgi:hypothetical protein